jgi:hypothetical protein
MTLGEMAETLEKEIEGIVSNSSARVEVRELSALGAQIVAAMGTPGIGLNTGGNCLNMTPCEFLVSNHLPGPGGDRTRIFTSASPGNAT